MDANVPTTGEQQQQLIPMSLLSSSKNLNEDNLITICETNPNIEKLTSPQTKPQTFLLRYYLQARHRLLSAELPHLSDNKLRIIFLIFITLIALTSFTIAIIVGTSVVQFKQQCPLYASFKFHTSITNENSWLIKIIPLTEKFSSQSTCDFCTFYNVFTFIYCIMTGFFFVLFNADERIVTTNDQCLIIPWFPISIILGFSSLLNASILTNGFLKFCSNITSNDSHITSCTQLNQVFFEQYPNVSSLFYYMLLAIIASWFQLAFFIGIITVLTIRLGSSFDWSNNKDQDGRPMNILKMIKSLEQTKI